ncbi:MAG TPA: PEP-CTERM sorting domain-containing protein [Thermoguttaceae bacterium]|nr:PEP-CTERM sorting domain-containing protein [Thermoguttaceae bacterium]
MTILIVVVVVAWLGMPAAADDIRPPVWRGEWSTTYQYWNFGTPVTGQLPDEGLKPTGPGPLVEGNFGEPYVQPGYLPSTRLWVYPFGDWIDVDPVSGRQGIWPLSGSIEAVVDNHNPPNEYKWVWLQLTWRPQDPFTGFSIGSFDPAASDFRLVEDVSQANGWTTSVYEWFIRPNPPDEWFTINGTIDVDQLVIDTWCVPEPSALVMLLGMSLIAVWRRKR